LADVVGAALGVDRDALRDERICMLYQRGADLIAAEHLAAMGGGGGMLGFSATGGGGGGGDRGGGGGGEASLCKKELSLLTRLVDIARGRMAQILKAMRRSAKFATVLTSVDPTVSHWICSGDGKHGGGGGGGVGGGGKRGGGAGGAPPSLGATFEMLMEVQGRMEELRDKRGAQGGGGGDDGGGGGGSVSGRAAQLLKRVIDMRRSAAALQRVIQREGLLL
jgi:hypothetical protein